ncbi:SDR family oxidoreductase [Salinisphaera sp. SPP-AMP-43]|uniref:SDR family oxidoreductase n=1 Tax=Salinisphaera sp. SPP-AMP-43 TaxID=3121288 RepID=UPI003C6E7735
MSSNRLADKVALISGGAGGMGASHARAIVAEGGRVVIGDLAQEAGEALAQELGEAAVFTPLDVTDTEQWEQAVATAQAHFGQLNVLVNNAGIHSGGPTERVSDADWDRIVGINLTGTFKGIRAAIPALKEAAPSSIVNISSTAGLKGFADAAGYNATKFGIRGLTKAVAVELADKGVRVNSVHPGNVMTSMIEGLYASFDHVPMKRAAAAEEISNLVVFLASDDSSFSTGSEFVADGGETTGIPDLFD